MYNCVYKYTYKCNYEFEYKYNIKHAHKYNFKHEHKYKYSYKYMCKYTYGRTHPNPQVPTIMVKTAKMRSVLVCATISP